MKDELELSKKSLKDNLERIEELKKESEILRKAHFRYEEIWEEIPKIERKNKKIYTFLSNNTWRLKPELNKIAKKLIEAQENHKFLDKNQDYLIFDEIDDDFVSFGRGENEYHIKLIKTHFRHYDLMTIIKSVERITKKKVNEWYLLTSKMSGLPAWVLSLTLIDNEFVKSGRGD